MTHDEKSVDRLLKSLQPPRFDNRAHQALLRERIAASAADMPDLGKMEKMTMFMTGKFQSKLRWAVAAACVALVAVVFWGVSGSGSSKAYAQAVRKLREARKMSMIATINDGTSTPLRVELAFMAPSIIRKVQDHTISIVDVAASKGILIVPAEKRYLEMRVDLTSQTAGMDNLITSFRSLPLAADKKLGLKNIRGKVAEGFSVNSDGSHVETWVDPASGDPIQIDIRMQPGSGMTLSMTDIKLEPPMDDALFSLAPPAGYMAVTTPDDNIPPTEQDLVGLLRFWAENSPAKRFPDTLDPLTIVAQMRAMAASFKNVPMEEQIKTGLMIQRAMLFIIGMDPRAEWQYAGKGLGLKDGDTPVFWWRPQGATKYHVITANLRIRELDEQDFPALALYRNQHVRISESTTMQKGFYFDKPGELDGKGGTRDEYINLSGYGGDWTDNRLPASDARYDVRVKMPKGQERQFYPALRKALEAHFGYATRFEMREATVYVLIAPQGRPAALADPQKTTGSSVMGEHPVKYQNMGLDGLTGTLRGLLSAPVFNETGLKGRFDYAFNPGSSRDPQSLAAAVRDQLGLELKPVRRSIKFLVIEPVPTSPAAR